MRCCESSSSSTARQTGPLRLEATIEALNYLLPELPSPGAPEPTARLKPRILFVHGEPGTTHQPGCAISVIQREPEIKANVCGGIARQRAVRANKIREETRAKNRVACVSQYEMKRKKFRFVNVFCDTQTVNKIQFTPFAAVVVFKTLSQTRCYRLLFPGVVLCGTDIDAVAVHSKRAVRQLVKLTRSRGRHPQRAGRNRTRWVSSTQRIRYHSLRTFSVKNTDTSLQRLRGVRHQKIWVGEAMPTHARAEENKRITFFAPC